MARKWIVVGKERFDERAGGLNRYVDGFVAELEKSTQVVVLVSSRVKEQSDARYRYLRGNVLQRTLRAFFASALAYRRGPAVLNSHFALYGVPAMLAVKAVALASLSKPVIIVHFHGPWGAESRTAGLGTLSNQIKTILDRLSLKMADHVITLSHHFASVAIEMGAEPEKVHVIAPGLTPLIRGSQYSESAQTAIIKAPSKPTIHLICVRRLTARMGHLDLIRDLNSLDFQLDGRRILLTIVGQGSERQSIEEAILQAGAERFVKLAGSVSDQLLDKLYAESSVSIVPTLDLEGFGLIVLESMQRGIPVVTTGRGGLTEAMGPWSTSGLVYTPGQPPTLERALRIGAAMAEDSDTRQRLQAYAGEFTWANVLSKVRTLQ